MSWSDLAQIAMPVLGVILGAFLAFWREDRQRVKREAREDLLWQRQREEWVSQRWWERKATAYTEIVEALWQHLEYVREYSEHLYGERQNSPSHDSDKYRDMNKQRVNLRRAAEVGAFVISDEVASSLQRYFTEFQDEIMEMGDVIDQVDANYKATERCLKEVSEAALHDLNVTRGA